MNLVVQALRLFVPTTLKRRKLDALFTETAKVFDTRMPDLRGLSFDRRLESYAVFTKTEVEKLLKSDGDLQPLKNNLYRIAYQLGDELRRQLRLRDNDDVLAVGRALYRSIGIDFEGKANGEVTIHSCFFSKYYSKEVCAVISSLDEGIAAGLSGGGTLSFSHRLTDGSACCKATFDFAGGEK